MSLHERSDDELKAKLFSGELGEKKLCYGIVVPRESRYGCKSMLGWQLWSAL